MVRLRTLEQAHAELIAADPNCALTKTALRRLVTTGKVQSTRVGAKYLVDLDRIETYLFEEQEEPRTPAGIRRVDVRGPELERMPERSQMGR